MTETRGGERSPPATSTLIGGPPIFSTIQYKHLKKRVVHHSTARTITVICFVSGVLVFFFSSIYIGTTYLQEHLADEKWGNSLGVRSLPNTRNKLSKWTKEHLHVDLTDLGRPMVVQGTGADKSAFAKEANAKTRIRDNESSHSGSITDKKHGSTVADAAVSARRTEMDDNTPLSRIKKKLADKAESLSHSRSRPEAEVITTTAATKTADAEVIQGMAGSRQRKAASASLRGGVSANSDSNSASDASVPHLPPYIPDGTDSNESGGSSSDSSSRRGLKKETMNKLFKDLRKTKKSIGHLAAGEGPGTDAGTKKKRS